MTPYEITDSAGRRWWILDTSGLAVQLRIPLDWDPSTGMMVAVSPAGIVLDMPLFLKGNNGDSPNIRNINLTELAWNDPTPASGSSTLVSDGDGVNPPEFDINLALHGGQPGTNGTSVLDPTQYGSPLPGLTLVVNGTSNGFVYQHQLCGDEYYPVNTDVVAAVSGHANSTIATVHVPAQPFAWRPEVNGQTNVASSGAGITVNLYARLNNATTGQIVSQCFGVSGLSDRLILSPGMPTGAATSANLVAANTAAVIYLTTELQSGSATYTTTPVTTSCRVKVNPVLQ